MAEFETRFQNRVRAFAASGVRPVDASVVARAVAARSPGRLTRGWAGSRRGRPFDRWFGWVALATAAVVATAVVLPLLSIGLIGGPSPTPGLVQTPSVTAAPEPSTSAAPPPSRLGIAYRAEVGGIQVMDWETGEAVTLFDDESAENCGHASGVSLSPDGRWIAYRTGVYGPGITTGGECSPLLHIMDLAGRSVGSFPGWGEPGVAWSDDSSMVATWLDFGVGGRTIAIYGVDGIRKALVEAPERNGEYDVGWSDNGSPSVNNRGLRDWEIPIDGSPPRPYEAPAAWTRPAWSEDNATYSPDGLRMAVTIDTSLRSLVLATRDGAVVRELTFAGPVDGVDYSPDGQRIAVRVGTSLTIITRDGDIVRELALEAAVNQTIWSPSGGSIGYFQGDELRLVDVETGAVTTSRLPGPARPLGGYSPDGSWLLVEVGGTADAAGDLWAVSVDGADARRIAENVSMAGWVPLPEVE